MAGKHRRKPKGVHYATPHKWKLADVDSLNLRDLRNWIRDMVDWGERVRQDILRLERHARLAKGDPGDPPPKPQ